jgi:hypothetical protein
MGIPIRTAASVGEPLNSTFLVAIEDLIASLAGDSELPAKLGQWLAGYPASPAMQSLKHYRTHLTRDSSHPN